MFQPSPFGKYLCEDRTEMLHLLFCLAAVGTCLSAGPSDQTSINPVQRTTCQASSLLSHQSIVTLQIVSQGALLAVGDEEEGGSDKSVVLNCYRFSCLNLFFFFSSSGRLRVRAEVQRCHAAVIQSDICRNPSSFSAPHCPVCGKLKSEASWESLPNCQSAVNSSYQTLSLL